MRARRVPVIVLAAIAVVLALSACSAPADPVTEFRTWAVTQEFVASVDAQPANGLTAHLVVEGAITGDELLSLAAASRDEAAALGVASPSINIIVGNAWGFSADAAGENVATITALRDDPAFVGATVGYEPLNSKTGDSSGLRGVVGSQAALRDAYAALVAAAGDDVEGVAITASTADGAFVITGTGATQPEAAIALWQAISGRVLIAAATAGPDGLEISVGSAADQTAAEAIGAEHPDVKLTVHLQG